MDIQTDDLQVLPKLNFNTLFEVAIFLLEAKSLIAVLTFLINTKTTTKYYKLFSKYCINQKLNNNKA